MHLRLLKKITPVVDLHTKEWVIAQRRSTFMPFFFNVFFFIQIISFLLFPSVSKKMVLCQMKLVYVSNFTGIKSSWFSFLEINIFKKFSLAMLYLPAKNTVTDLKKNQLILFLSFRFLQPSRLNRIK